MSQKHYFSEKAQNLPKKKKKNLRRDCIADSVQRRPGRSGTHKAASCPQIRIYSGHALGSLTLV